MNSTGGDSKILGKDGRYTVTCGACLLVYGSASDPRFLAYAQLEHNRKHHPDRKSWK